MFPSPEPSKTREALLSLLIGTWGLVSYAVYPVSSMGDESKAISPYGPNATGFITYTAQGYVSMHFCNPGQAHHKSGMPTNSTDAELAESARRYLAYAGPFDLITNGKGEQVVVHRPEVSLYPNWLGSAQRRLVKMDDEGEMLTLWPETPFVLHVSFGFPTFTSSLVAGPGKGMAYWSTCREQRWCQQWYGED